METERLFAAAKELIGARTDYPFEGDRDTAVFRHGAGKWFGICLYVPLKYFGEGAGSEYCLNLKCPPDLAQILCGTYRGVLPAYHMNKTHWITVRLHSDVPDEEIVKLLNLRYDLTLPRAKKQKQSFGSLSEREEK